MLFTKPSTPFSLSKTEVLDTAYIKEVTLEWKTLKTLTASRFVKDLISVYVLTLLRFLRKLFLCFETKYPLRNTCSGQRNLSYPTTIVSNSVPTDLKLTSSLNNFKPKLKIYFLRNSKTWNKMSLLIDTVLGTSTVIFSILIKSFYYSYCWNVVC